VKYWLIILPAAAFAQQTAQTYITDVNGRRNAVSEHAAALSGKDTIRTERSRSVNGQKVPLEQVEERVLRDDASGRQIERIVRKFDHDGRLSQTEKTTIHEQKRADGSLSRSETTLRSTVNGRFEPTERRVTETRKEGNSTNSETVIERPASSGAFQAVEKRSVVETQSGDVKQDHTTVYRVSQNGEFYEALRQTREQRKEATQVVENVANYEPDVAGRLQLASQEIKRSSKRSDGTEVSEVNIYAKSIPGRVNASGSGQQLMEQQVIERRPQGPDGVVETLSVRRPTISDPTRLGELKRISETVCQGKCQP
jgi:hypothetical protein